LVVYAADQNTVLGKMNGAGQYGTTLKVTLAGVTAGQQLYVRVKGADGSAFSTGRYALVLNTGGGPTPTVPPSIIPILDGDPINGGGGVAEGAGEADDYLDSIPGVTGISPDNGLSTNDGVTNVPNLWISCHAPEDSTISVYINDRPVGTAYAYSSGAWSYTTAPLAAGTYSFTATDTNLAGSVSPRSSVFKLQIGGNATTTTTPVLLNNLLGELLGLDSSTPIFVGVATPGSVVTVFDGFTVLGTAKVGLLGLWVFVSPALPSGTHTIFAEVTNSSRVTGLISQGLKVTA
jgi:hypothetical protein